MRTTYGVGKGHQRICCDVHECEHNIESEDLCCLDGIRVEPRLDDCRNGKASDETRCANFKC